MAHLGRPVGALVAGALVLCGCSFGITGSSEPTDIGARLSGDVETTRADTTQWWFEYGPTSAYMNNTPHRSVSFPNLSQPYSDCPTPTDASFPYFGGVLPPVLTSGDFIFHDHASS